ncbi:MAG: hypothetical protein PHU88_03625 [candidate division Zixibacteria bacterium]|nr:hypothetical protein [candidate division Zixibacteria bacterium]MDD5426494.1 hypothetical protein [candidate division Zixibacteria bacterium]
MKKLLIIISIILIVVPFAEARRKVKKAGEINNNVYIDNDYGFKLTLNNEWNSRIRKGEENYRLVLVKKNYDIPMEYKDAPDYTQVPRIIVYADTSSIPILAFIDSLMSDSYKSEQKKNILKEFEILNESDLIPKGRKPISIGKSQSQGFQWLAQAKYTKEVATSAASLGGQRVYSSYGGAIVAINNNNTILLFHLMCEYQFFEPIFNQMLQIINTLEWVEQEG